MSIKGLIFIGLFGLCAVGALFFPPLGIYGYLADYCINPSGQWWGAPFFRMGLRGSFTLAVATLVGILLHHKKMQFGEKFLHGQEWSLLILLSLVWALTFYAPETVGRYATTDHPSLKLTKILVFALMMTHVITDIKKLRALFWVLSTASLVLGLKAWNTPYGSFIGGRLEGIGGADFREANFLASFMAAMLPLIAIQFLHSKNWIGKVYAVICGVFTANAVILCRSRGAFLGMAIGALASLLLAPRKLRIKILVLFLIGVVGIIYLSDEYFISRITTITTDQANMDTSAFDRIELWKAGARIFAQNPMGIGPGNWFQTVGAYIYKYQGLDAHNTYLKCAVELGILGIFLFALFIYQAFSNLRKIAKGLVVLLPENANDFRLYIFSIAVSIVILLTCALTITMIYTEIVWVLLVLPVCLRRALANATIANSQIEESNSDQMPA